MRVLMIVAMALAMFGCATGPMNTPYKAQNPAKQGLLDQAVAQCKYEAEVGATSAGAGARGAIEIEYRKNQARDSLFGLCMAAKGWPIS